MRPSANKDTFQSETSSSKDCAVGATDTTLIQKSNNGTYVVCGNADVFDSLALDFQNLFIDAGHDAFPNKMRTLKVRCSVGKRIKLVKYNYEDRQKSPCPYYMHVAYIPGTNIGYTEYICNDTQLNTIPENMSCAQMYTYRLFRYRDRFGSGRNKKQIIKSMKVSQRVGCELRFIENHHNKNCFPTIPDTVAVEDREKIC